jgi:cob(I)alamin adenosyltransferase
LRIYTRTGDRGTTGLIGGSRVDKSSPIIEAIGAVDEVNSAIGVCVASLPANHSLRELLERIQHWLFDAGAELADDPNRPRVQRTDWTRAIDILERSMDQQTEALPPLRAFILPGGSAEAAHLHHARCVCRRAEREVLRARQEPGEIEAWLNRLSDWLFMAARTANALAGVSDVEWVKTEDRDDC